MLVYKRNLEENKSHLSPQIMDDINVNFPPLIFKPLRFFFIFIFDGKDILLFLVSKDLRREN